METSSGSGRPLRRLTDQTLSPGDGDDGEDGEDGEDGDDDGDGDDCEDDDDAGGDTLPFPDHPQDGRCSPG